MKRKKMPERKKRKRKLLLLFRVLIYYFHLSQLKVVSLLTQVQATTQQLQQVNALPLISSNIRAPSAAVWERNGRSSSFLPIGPRFFASEPSALSEYSNSTGITLNCRAQQPNYPNELPALVSWRQIRSLPGTPLSSASHASTKGGQDEEQEQERDRELAEEGQEVELVEPGKPGDSRYIRADGSLIVSPFRAGEFQRGIHSASYRCCLHTIRAGSQCSRPVHTRAVIDSPLKLDVFDELTQPGNSVLLKCQAPNQLVRYTQVIAWLREGRELTHLWNDDEQEARRRRRQHSLSRHSLHHQEQLQEAPLQRKHLLLADGSLLVRNVTRADTGPYRCRARHRVTGIIATSLSAGRIILEDSSAAADASRPAPEAVVWARPGSQALLCVDLHRRLRAATAEGSSSSSSSSSSSDETRCVWFLERSNTDTRREPVGVALPEARSLGADCLLVSEVRVEHSGRYVCEGGGSGGAARLVVLPGPIQVHLTAREGAGPGRSPTVASDSSGSAPMLLPGGASVQLNCSVQFPPEEYTLAWYKDTQLIAWASRLNGHSSDSSSAAQPVRSSGAPSNVRALYLDRVHLLQVSFFGMRDRGVYQCQVFSSSSSLTRAQVNPQAGGSHSKLAWLVGNQSETRGGQAEVAATTQPIGASDRLLAQLERDLLERSAGAAIQLEVILSRPAVIHKFPASTGPLLPPIDSSLTLECVASGLPRPKIVWLLDEQLIFSASSSVNEQISPASGSGKDEEATDPSSASFSDVQLPLEFASSNELVSLMSSNLLEVQWPLARYLPLMSALGSQEHESRFRVSNRNSLNAHGISLTSSQLNVSQLSARDGGLYKCLAINPLGRAEHSFQVGVAGEPSLRGYQETNLTLLAGQSVSLQCPLSGYPPFRVDWFHRTTATTAPPGGSAPATGISVRLPANHRQRLSPTGKLELLNVDKLTDSGTYTCYAHANDAKVAPTGMSNQLARTGEAEAAAAEVVEPEMEAGTVLGRLEVNVRVAPMIDAQSLPELIQANENQRTKLICSVVQGEHPVEIRWLRRVRSGFEPVQNWPSEGGTATGSGSGSGSGGASDTNNGASVGSDAISIHNLEDSCLLTFRQISRFDSGDYLCLARNEFGRAGRLTRLVVNVAPSWANEPEEELSVQLGSRLQLECSAFGYPSPLSSWRRQQPATQVASQLQSTSSPIITNLPDDEPLLLLEGGSSSVTAYQRSNSQQRVFPNGTLLIESLELADAGAYICEAANGIGSGLSKLVRVRVNVPPHFRSRTQQTIGGSSAGGGLQTVLAPSGGKGELRCVALGDQPMVVGWRRAPSGEVVELVRDPRQREVRERTLGPQALESVLFIPNLIRNDSGQYECVASNQFGTNEFRLQLLVQETPEAPQLLRPIRALARQATVSFERPYEGNSPIVKYELSFKLLSSLSGSFPMLPALAPAGSEKQIADFELGAPVAAGSLFNEDTTNATSIGWQQVLLEPPEGQLVNLFPEPPEELLQQSELQAADHQLVSLNLCCLQPFTRYVIRVRAINGVGRGRQSRPVQFSTDEEVIGGPPVEVSVEPTGAHSLKVRWRPPARHLQHGLLRGYYIGYRAVSDLRASPSSAQPISQHHHHHHQQQQQQQQQDPQQLAASQESDQFQYKNVQLELSGTSSSIVVMAGSSGILPGSQQSLQVPEVLTSYLTNLRRKTAYVVIVQAYNKVGAGPRSDQVLVWTLDAAPPMSPLLRVVSVSHNSALLAWSNRKFPPPSSHIPAVSSSQATNRRSSGSSLSEVESSSSTGSSLMGSHNNYSSQLDEESDDDPQSYLTINFRAFSTSIPPSSSSAGGSSIRNSLDEPSADEWQQRRLSRRQAQPYVLGNLRCGSQHIAYMTATNSLGQSEPGEQVKFNTLGGAPQAPANSRDFIQVNSSYVLLHLTAWRDSGCPISAFILKYRAEDQLKWTVLEQQLQQPPAASSGSSNLSSRPLTALVQSAGSGPQELVLRNLVANSLYKLLVEATSEAGSTLVEYQLDTANLTSSTLSVRVHGLIPSPSERSQADEAGNLQHPRTELGETETETDFGYTGNQRAQNNNIANSIQQRYPLGVWSLTVLFVLASVFMAGTALLLGLRSLLGRQKLPFSSSDRTDLSEHQSTVCSASSRNQRRSRNTHPLSALLCCSGGTSSAASSAPTDSSQSSSTCYQIPNNTNGEHPMDAYCSLPVPARTLGLVGQVDDTPTRAISNQQLPSLYPNRQLVSSSSLSTIGGLVGSSIQYPHQPPLNRYAQTLSRRLMMNSNATADYGDSAEHIQNIRAHYAATLGRHNHHHSGATHSSFVPAPQPIKYNSIVGGAMTNQPATLLNDDLYEIQQHNNSNTNYHLLPAPLSSSGGTSGYETTTTTTTGGGLASNSLTHKLAVSLTNTAPDSHYLQLQQDPNGNQQLSMYCAPILSVSNNNDEAANNSSANNLFQQQNATSNQLYDRAKGQFHYHQQQQQQQQPNEATGRSLSPKAGVELTTSTSCQQQSAAEQQLSSAAYGIIFGNQQEHQLQPLQQSATIKSSQHHHHHHHQQHHLEAHQLDQQLQMLVASQHQQQ